MIAEHGNLRVVELELTKDKPKVLWECVKHYPTLFSDLTRGSEENFAALLADPNSFWLELQDDKGTMKGIIYLTNLQWTFDADAHIVIFDRELADKVQVCKQVIEWLFINFPLNRLTASIPAIYFATIRFAKRLGFKEEGIKRKVYLIGKRWVDEQILGILRAEIL